MFLLKIKSEFSCTKLSRWLLLYYQLYFFITRSINIDSLPVIFQISCSTIGCRFRKLLYLCFQAVEKYTYKQFQRNLLSVIHIKPQECKESKTLERSVILRKNVLLVGTGERAQRLRYLLCTCYSRSDTCTPYGPLITTRNDSRV